LSVNISIFASLLIADSLASSGPPVVHNIDLNLNCFVYGDEPGRIFPIQIAQTKTVGDLRKAIKDEKKNAFRDVDADRLDLWKVSDLMSTILCVDADYLIFYFQGQH